MHDELDELQKIYFTFLKRWTDGSYMKDEPNKAVIYEVHSDEDILELADEGETQSNFYSINSRAHFEGKI